MSDEELPWNVSTPITVNVANVKLPVFTSCDPFTWFVRVEAQFRSKNIVRSQTKSDYILQILPESVCTRIAAFLRKNPTDIDYEELKKEILKKYSLTSSERVQKVLELICHPLADRSPSNAWDEITTLLTLPDGEIDLQRELWLLHLPEPVRAGLHDSTSLSTEELLEKADNLQISHRAAIRRCKNTPFIASILSKCLDTLESESDHEEPHGIVSQQSFSSAAAIVHPSFSNRPKQKDSRQRFRREPRQGYLTPSGYCNYHAKWGANAYYCVHGCSWKNGSKNEMGASQQMAPRKK